VPSSQITPQPTSLGRTNSVLRIGQLTFNLPQSPVTSGTTQFTRWSSSETRHLMTNPNEHVEVLGTRSDYKPTSSRKILRKARHMSGRATTLMPSAPQTQGFQVQDTRVVDLETYECFACGDEPPLSAGIITCEFHFMCNECAQYAFILSSDDVGARSRSHVARPSVSSRYSIF
jgi:hypothetical protein